MSPPRRVLLAALVAIGLIAPVGALTPLSAGAAPAAPLPAPAAVPVLDLETLTGPEAIEMMENGELTSVQLTLAYIERIEALNKEGPGLNAVTQLNAYALEEAAAMDAERAAGIIRGPAHGLPALLKDLIDVKGMYTSNGNYSLRRSYPEEDAGMVKKLRESGVVILGKLGLSEYANSFGNQPSGFSNLTGQVLHGLDADQNPSGSSSGSGTAGAAALSMLTVGTETSGSIISPATAQSLVGIRPTVGLVPAYGIGPISSSQDTAGPMDRTVANAAMHLQSMVGRDLKNEAGYEAVFGPNWRDSIKQAPDEVPDYMSALDLSFVAGKRIGYNGTFTPGTPAALAFDALVAAGAIMVERPVIAVDPVPALPPGYQQHKAINEYYKNLGPNAPIKSLAEEVADNQANAQQALKFGNNSHLNALAADISEGGANETAYRAAMPIRRAAQWAAIDRMMGNDTPDPSDDFLAILGTVPSGATAGTPQITIPMGYNLATRRAQGVSIHGNAMSERNLIGVAYVIEQGTKLRQTASSLNPSMYRCADTVPAPPYAERGACNPDFDSVMAMLGGTTTVLPYALETESAASLQARLSSGELSATTLVKAYLTRIALTNAAGPSLQAVRSLNAGVLADAAASDQERAAQGPRGPLHGLPVLVDDSIDVAGLPTTGGSIALQGSIPTVDATVVAKLRAAGAIILGKTNVSELNGLFDVGMPEGYSSIGGQVLLPSDTDKTPAGSSAGSAAATAAGLATLTVGRQTSPDTAQLIAPAGVAGVVGLKPTVGLVSRAGVMPVSSSQDSTGALTRTVVDAAAQLTAVAGADPLDPATAAATPSTDYVAGLSPSALNGGRVAVVSNTTAPYPTVVSTLQSLGASTVVTAAATPDPNPPSIVGTEFKRDLNAYLAGTGGTGAKSLAEIIAYNEANPVEGLKYLQGELVAADAVDLSDPATASAYEANLAAGRDSSRALLDSVFTSGTAADPADDVSVIAVPTGNPLIGVADRAGYPILTVPAGYGTGNAGRNPIGVTFIGPAFGEAQLLAAGYAYEQATNVRLAPSVTNPSMFRCVPGSAFFTAERCHPGDPYFRLAAAADAPVATDGTYVTDVDVALDVPAPGVLADDSGSGLSAELEASTAKGSLNFRSDGSFTYVPEPGFVGSVRFTYRAVGATGRSAPATVAIDVRPPNVLPTAGLSVTPVTGTAPLAVTADASSSVDPDGEIVGYSWSFGNGQTASGVTASATYDTPGTYVVSLTVIDDRGGTATATSTVTVAAPPVRDQVSVSFTGSRTYAASGPISSGDLRIARDGIGINRITGTAALPGPTAAPATVTFNLSRLLFLNVFTGSVTVRDPSVAGFGTVTTSATLVPLTSLRSSTASGVLYGSLGFFRPYTLRFSVQDLA